MVFFSLLASDSILFDISHYAVACGSRSNQCKDTTGMQWFNFDLHSRMNVNLVVNDLQLGCANMISRYEQTCISVGTSHHHHCCCCCCCFYLDSKISRHFWRGITVSPQPCSASTTTQQDFMLNLFATVCDFFFSSFWIKFLTRFSFLFFVRNRYLYSQVLWHSWRISQKKFNQLLLLYSILDLRLHIKIIIFEFRVQTVFVRPKYFNSFIFSHFHLNMSPNSDNSEYFEHLTKI